MAIASNSSAGKYIQDGLILVTASTGPDLSVYIDNTIRILQLNQVSILAKRQAISNAVLEALGKPERIVLEPIPDSQFSNCDAIDYNQKNCQVAAVRETDPIAEGTRTDLVRIAVGFPVAAKNKNPLFTSRMACAMLEAYQEIIETYILLSPKDFVFSFPDAPRSAGVVGQNIRIVPDVSHNDLLSQQMSNTGVKAYLEFSLKVYINSIT